MRSLSAAGRIGRGEERRSSGRLERLRGGLLGLGAGWAVACTALPGCAGADARPTTSAAGELGPRAAEPTRRLDGGPQAPPPAAGAEPDAGTTGQSPRPAAPAAAGAEAVAALREPGEMALGAGRSRHRIELPDGERFVSVGVIGEPTELLGFELSAPAALGDLRANESLGEDGRLPRFASFVARGTGTTVEVMTDLRSPGRLVVWWVDPADRAPPEPRALRAGEAAARPLVGLPMPVDERDGYTLETAQRYLFLRVDVAVALREALRQTRVRFRRNPIALGHASEWDGTGPGTDQGKSMHIGHRGGREIDLGLPSSDDSPSSITRRCQGVLVERSVLRCEPGTVRDLDAMRLAYLLGLLIDGPTPNGIHMPKGRPGPTSLIDSILTDESYIEQIRRAAQELRRKNWIHDEGFAALMEDGILRPSPWHTDHVHLRFAGEDGRPALGKKSRGKETHGAA